MRFPSITTPDATTPDAALSATPSVVFPEITLPAPEAVPPIVLFDAVMSTPSPLGTGTVPAAFVPMKFPSNQVR